MHHVDAKKILDFPAALRLILGLSPAFLAIAFNPNPASQPFQIRNLPSFPTLLDPDPAFSVIPDPEPSFPSLPDPDPAFPTLPDPAPSPKIRQRKKFQIITVQVLDRASSFLKAFLSFFMETIHSKYF
jgi:hypothetical protein